jgi:hypothetical protein
VLGRATPQEAFTRKRPDVSHFRIFGSLVYCHVPSKSRKKLEPTAVKGIFVGYSKRAKAYRVYVPALRRTVITRDTRFEEGMALKKSLESEQSTPKDEQQAPKQEAQSSHQSPTQPTVRQFEQHDEEKIEEVTEERVDPTQPVTPSTGRRRAKWVN